MAPVLLERMVLAGASGAGDVHDPFGGGPERYRACRGEIARCLARGLDRLLES
jgi:hypothetical protein